MPSTRRQIFDTQDLAGLPAAPGRILPIASSAMRPLGKPQRAFNRLLAQVQALREELPIWRAAMERYQQRIAGEIGPLERELLRHQCDAVHWLDALLASTAKADRLSRR